MVNWLWDPEWNEIAIVGALAFLLALYVVLSMKRAFARRRRRWRALAALSAERRALSLLDLSGYTVRAAQVGCPWPVMVGRRRVEVELRADYLVERGSQAFVAEVKNGAYVARIRHGPTRRQLLEYQLAYGVDGVLLVDIERKHIHLVRFPALERS